MKENIGRIVEVVIDRPLGSCHPEHKKMIYPINYGYIPSIIGGDGEEQDAYILGVNVPIQKFYGTVIAIIVRKNDDETKWVVASKGEKYSVSDIRNAVEFQEKYFDSEIII